MLIVLTVSLLTTSIIAQTEDLTAYDAGKDLNKLLKFNARTQESIINDDKFIDGIKDALKEDPEAQKKIAEIWVKKGEKSKSLLLSDVVKNKIWEVLTLSQRETHIKELAILDIQKQFPGKEVDPEKVKKRIEKITLTKDLKWEGTKLIDKKSNNWVDFEDFPVWTTSIEFMDDKLQLGFDTGKGIKKVILHQGSIDKDGYLIGPRGNIIGTPLYGGVQSIEVKDNTIGISYKNINGEDQKLSFTFDELNQLASKSENDGLSSLLKILDENEPSKGQAARTAIIDVLNKFDFKSDLSSTKSEKLNVMYGGRVGKEETIEISYDRAGTIKTQITEGGTLVSTNSKGDVTKIYKQFFSKDGASGSGEVTNAADLKRWGTSDEEGTLLFDTKGKVIAGRNIELKEINTGITSTSRTHFVGIDIEEDPIFSGIKSGDPGAIAEALVDFKKLQKAFETGTYVTTDANGNRIELKIDTQFESILADAINKRLESGEFEKSTKAIFDDLLNKFNSNLEHSQDVIVESILFPSDDDPTLEQNLRKERIKDSLKFHTNEAIKVLAEKENVKKLILGTEQEKKVVIRDVLKGRLSESGLIEPIARILDKNPKILAADLNKQIDSIFDESTPKLNFRASLEAVLREKEKELGEGTVLADPILAMLDETERILKKEEKEFKASFFPSYDNKIVINTQTREVHLIGNKYIAFDAKAPLTKVSGTSTWTSKDPAGDFLNLYSNGKLVAQFEGERTNGLRAQPNEQYVAIDQIINTERTKIDFQKFSILETSGAYGQNWAIKNPHTIGTRRKGSVIITGVPTLGRYLAADFKLQSPDLNNPNVDIAASSGTKITIANYAAYGEGDPNFQTALDIAAQRRDEATSGIGFGLLNFFTLGYAGRYADNKAYTTAYNEFFSSQDPGKVARGIADGIQTEFGNTLSKVYRSWGGNNEAAGKVRYESFAREKLNAFGGSGLGIFPTAAADQLFTSLPEGRQEVKRFTDFIARNPTHTLTFTNKGLTTADGTKFEGDPRVIRTLLRSIGENIRTRHKEYE